MSRVLSPAARLVQLSLTLALTSMALPPAQAAVLPDYGAVPELAGIERWHNSPPLTLASLRGKVVLVDFWTYSCINCIRTMPYVRKWHEQFKNQGLVVVGVHTPEYPYERDQNNVAAAIKRFNLGYPVAQDNRYATWRNFSNEYWPAVYLVDRKGRVRMKHTGEGNYAETEQAIQQLLAEAGPTPAPAPLPVKAAALNPANPAPGKAVLR